MAEKVLKSEANDTTIEFEFDGVTYTVPSPKKWPLSVVRAQEAGKILGAVEKLLGKQFAKFDVDDSRTMDDLNDFITKMFEAADLDPKE